MTAKKIEKKTEKLHAFKVFAKGLVGKGYLTVEEMETIAKTVGVVADRVHVYLYEMRKWDGKVVKKKIDGVNRYRLQKLPTEPKKFSRGQPQPLPMTKREKEVPADTVAA